MSRSTSARLVRQALGLLLLCSLLFQVQPPGVTHALYIIFYVKPAATGSGSCNSWANACALQTALTSSTKPDEIWVMQGTYTPGSTRTDTFQLKNGVGVYGGFAGNETLRAQRGLVANLTILSGEIGAAGNADNSNHVVSGTSLNITAVLDGFTITAGNADGDPLALDTYGGGMFLHDSANPSLTNLIFSANSASLTNYGTGGGLANLFSSKPTLTNVTFVANTSVIGGGMYNGYTSSSTLTNVTFSANQAPFGAGMDNDQGSNPILTNVTFSGNLAGDTSGYGGGIYNGNSSPIIRNVILWGNTAADGSQIYNGVGSTPDIQGGVIQGGCPLGSTCTSILTTNPRLGQLGSNGGATPTIPLLPGSSAIDAATSSCPALDQRGVTRSSPSCDIGAYESRGFTLTLTSGSGQSAPVNAAFGQSLTVTLTETGGGALPGAAVTFSAPSSGASAILSGPPPTTNASGVASVNASANAIIGSYAVTADASGLTASGSFLLTNTKADTNVVLTSSLNPSSQGKTVTLFAQVSSSGIPAGNVEFKKDGSLIPGCGTQALNGAGQASCTLTFSSVGSYSLTAEYSGAASYNSSISTSLTQEVNPDKIFLPGVRR